jgi:hypothetical protein
MRGYGAGITAIVYQNVTERSSRSRRGPEGANLRNNAETKLKRRAGVPHAPKDRSSVKRPFTYLSERIAVDERRLRTV